MAREMETSPRLTLHEIDASSGELTKTYLLTSVKVGGRQDSLRIDQVPAERKLSSRVAVRDPERERSRYLIFSPLSLLRLYANLITTYLKTLFLPTGYPHTVTPDYTPYQIYDSLQAFASSIAGLLSSRAVLQSLDIVSSKSGDGKISADSATAATAATLLSVLQSTLSNLTTILFASYAAPRVSSDVKFYRFLADVVNDTAFMLDLLAPALPRSTLIPLPILGTMTMRLSFSPRIIALCMSSMLRAVCGVAGGSSKAVLSAHFAQNNPESVGDLNAKDGSQETVVGLVGMWVGGYIVSQVEGAAATWCWMFILLALHLSANWCAVRSVRLRNLNKNRATIVFERMSRSKQLGKGQLKGDCVLTVDAIGRQESVLGIDALLRRFQNVLVGRSENDTDWRKWKVGASVEDMVQMMGGWSSSSHEGSLPGDGIRKLSQLFQNELYLLCIGTHIGRILIVLKREAQGVDQLKAWNHALLVQTIIQQEPQSQEPQSQEKAGIPGCEKQLAIIAKTLKELNHEWKQRCGQLESFGWDLSATNLEEGKGVRIQVDGNE